MRKSEILLSVLLCLTLSLLAQPESERKGYDFAQLGTVSVQRIGDSLCLQLVQDELIVKSQNISVDKAATVKTINDHNSLVICAQVGKGLSLTLLEIPTFETQLQSVDLGKQYIIQDLAWCNDILLLKASKLFDSDELLAIDTRTGKLHDYKSLLRKHKAYPDFLDVHRIDPNKCLIVGLYNHSSGLYSMVLDQGEITAIHVYPWDALEATVGKVGEGNVQVQNDTGYMLKGCETLEEVYYAMERLENKQFERYVMHSSLKMIGEESGMLNYDITSWCNVYLQMEPPYVNDEKWTLKHNFTVVTHLTLDDNGVLH